jgi:prevent-host-death family protein
MLDISRDIHPLTNFKRNTLEFLKQLRETGEPLVLTINGKPELVVQDARSYQRLRELVERLKTIEAVRSGLASMKRGEGRPLDEAFDRLEQELKPRSRK